MSFTEGEINEYGFDQEDVKVETTPLKRGGASFKTKDIIFTNGLAYTQKSKGAKIFSWTFFLIGDALVLFGIYLYFYKNEIEALLPLVIIGSIFSLVGFLMIKLTKKITFDKSVGVYYTTKNYNPMALGVEHVKQGKLRDIKHIQVLKELVKTDKSSFYSYEINLVLKDGNRLNVVDHGNLNVIKEQVQGLEVFLGIKVLENDILNQNEQFFGKI